MVNYKNRSIRLPHILFDLTNSQFINIIYMTVARPRYLVNRDSIILLMLINPCENYENMWGCRTNTLKWGIGTEMRIIHLF
jgi:hypothetical protein